MSWNYRVIEFVELNGEKYWAIHEVHYDDAGKPAAYGTASVMASDDEASGAGLGWVLDNMRKALSRPTLTTADFTGNADDV